MVAVAASAAPTAATPCTWAAAAFDAKATTPAPTALDGMWERAVRWWTAAPDALMEPWAGAVVNSIESFRAFRFD